MDRAEAGSAIDNWCASLDSSVWSNGEMFDNAFRKRFDSSRTADSALEGYHQSGARNLNR